MSKPIARMMSLARGERLVTKDIGQFRMSLNTAHWIDSQILLTGTFEPVTTSLIESLLQPGMIAVDVGANIGWLTLAMAAAVGPAGKVFAFEPSDWTYSRLTANVSLNNLRGVTPIRAAVGADDIEIELMLPCGYRLDGRDTATRQLVQCVRLDSYLPDTYVDVLKIDTDGAELEVIIGATRLIQRSRPAIVFEVITRSEEQKLKAIFNLLNDTGYQIYSEDLEPVENAMAFVKTIPTGTANLLAITANRLHDSGIIVPAARQTSTS